MKAVQAVLQLGLLVSVSKLSQAQSEFTEIDIGLPSLGFPAIAWGDYNNDGKLDVAVAGTGGPLITRIYRNNGDNTFSDIGADLAGASRSVAWGDFDNDGNLDLLLSSTGGPAIVYRNDGRGAFADTGAALPMTSGAIAWGDYNNDGRLDILLRDRDQGGSLVTRLYRNDADGTFLDSGVALPGVSDHSFAWADFNNDGRLDVTLTGDTGGPEFYISRVYRNDGNGSFTFARGFEGVVSGAVAWGDYNNDGSLDFLLTGLGIPNLNPIYARVYQNTVVVTNLTGVRRSAVAWGDYDNDGWLDIALTGLTDLTETNLISKIYRNTGTGSFVDVGAGLPGIKSGSVAWGDYDNDGDLDLLLTGSTTNAVISRLYRNESTVSNTVPTAPSGLTTLVSGQQVTLNWAAASDVRTAAPGLTYNIRVGTHPGGYDIVSPQSASNGWRRLPQRGNAEHRLFSTVVDFKGGIYYWSVQAVDTAFAGGPFAPEQTFVVPPAIQGIDLQANGEVLLRFLGTAGGTNYVLEASTNLTGWAAIANLMTDVGGMFQYAETNVTSIPVRFYRVRSP